MEHNVERVNQDNIQQQPHQPIGMVNAVQMGQFQPFPAPDMFLNKHSDKENISPKTTHPFLSNQSTNATQSPHLSYRPRL